MTTDDTESQIDAFIGRYSPAIELQLREARVCLRARFPRGFELVYDNYNALVFGISATWRTSGAFISLAEYSKWVTLFFLNGTDLHDPGGLLEGEGKQVRSIRLKRPEDICARSIEALIAQVVRPHASALLAAPPLTTIIKSVSAKQRPRRPALAMAIFGGRGTTARSVPMAFTASRSTSILRGDWWSRSTVLGLCQNSQTNPARRVWRCSTQYALRSIRNAAATQEESRFEWAWPMLRCVFKHPMPSPRTT